MPADSDNFKDVHRGWHSRGFLPHFDSQYVIQTITYRLSDSLPEKVIEQAKLDLKYAHEPLRMGIDKYLDSGLGSCSLRIPEIAQIVEANFQYFHAKRYDLIAWVVMPVK